MELAVKLVELLGKWSVEKLEAMKAGYSVADLDDKSDVLTAYLKVELWVFEQVLTWAACLAFVMVD